MDDGEHEWDQPTGLLAEACCDLSRMDAIGDDLSAGPAARELAREQHAAQLRVRVGIEGGVVVLESRIVQMELGEMMQKAGGVDHPRGRRREQSFAQTQGQ